MGKHWDEPHTVYRLLNEAGTLLYVGCTHQIMSRFAAHLWRQPWRFEIASIKVTWFPDEIRAKRAEAEAILTEHPTYNKMKVPVDAVGMSAQEALQRRPRGDGVHCPRCGNPKENVGVGHAYCNACSRAYRQEQRLKRKVLLPTPLCSVCGGPTLQAGKRCPACARKHEASLQAAWKEANPEKVKAYYEAHKIKKYQRDC